MNGVKAVEGPAKANVAVSGVNGAVSAFVARRQRFYARRKGETA